MVTSKLEENIMKMKVKEQETKQLGKQKLDTKNLVQISMLAAIATILMIFQMPVPFAPAFYQLDLSEVPILIGTFIMGPLAGVMIELIKIILNFIIDGTATAGIGELANFLMGCAFCIPAGLIYKRNKNKKNALVGCVVGTIIMTIVAVVLNAYVLLPVYASAFHMPIDGLIEMGTMVNGNINNLLSFVIFAVAPFNLLKGAIVTIVVMLSYKKLAVILRK